MDSGKECNVAGQKMTTGKIRNATQDHLAKPTTTTTTSPDNIYLRLAGHHTLPDMTNSQQDLRLATTNGVWPDNHTTQDGRLLNQGSAEINTSEKTPEPNINTRRLTGKLPADKPIAT